MGAEGSPKLLFKEHLDQALAGSFELLSAEKLAKVSVLSIRSITGGGGLGLGVVWLSPQSAAN